ncbi:MAG TPA: neutral zinc metallopeptidase [Polyangiaceae bacterium]|nr:neutral zinc metallopeptidase [Polyangiaceae bacterium]
MDIEGRRRSSKFEDRGSGGSGGGGGLPINALSSLVRLLGVKGTLVVGVIGAGVYFLAPAGLKQALLSALSGGARNSSQAPSGASGSACQASATNGKACDFSRAVLASTEDVWAAQFKEGTLPKYGITPPSSYPEPTLVVFSNSVSTGGCGSATSDVGPFYCPGDHKLYIDPSFYAVLEQRLKAPGDFAQAYVIAHEVGHHVQNLIGSTSVKPAGESKNQVSVRVELQADCLAGVWGHSARASLKIDDSDLKEAVTAAHAIGDDALGHESSSDYTHGSSAQRIRWFRRGFDSGDARQCDTFAVTKYAEL